MLPGLEGWYDAFYDLSSDRQIGMVAGPLPDSSIRKYVEGWCDEDAQAFKHCMRAMDAEFQKKPEDSVDPDLEASPNPARDAFRGAFRR